MFLHEGKSISVQIISLARLHVLTNILLQLANFLLRYFVSVRSVPFFNSDRHGCGSLHSGRSRTSRRMRRRGRRRRERRRKRRRILSKRTLLLGGTISRCSVLRSPREALVDQNGCLFSQSGQTNALQCYIAHFRTCSHCSGYN